MKILFFIGCMTAGGKERRLTELMKSLKKEHGISFELVVMSNDIHYKEVFDLGIKIHYLVRGTKKDVSIFNKFYKICKSSKPSVVHCWDSMTAVYAVPACKLLRIKLVNGMVVDTPVKQNISNKHWLRARMMFPFADMVIGNSRAGLAAYGAGAQRSVCIYNGMDLNRFSRIKDFGTMQREIFGSEIKSFFVIGMVAAFEERKDYKTLIRAAISLLNENDQVRFILVGDGKDMNTIRQSVPEELKDRVLFLGKRSDVDSVVNLFDLGVLLTNSGVHGEGISNSIIEYMALAKPVIATRGGGTNEVVIDGQNGFLIDNAREDQLLERIALFIKDPELRKSMGLKGQKMVEEKFDITKMTAQYLQTYRQLLKTKASA